MKLTIVYHVAHMGHWEEVVAEMYPKLQQIDADLYITCVGGAKHANWYRETFPENGIQQRSVEHCGGLKLYETPGMHKVQELSKSERYDAILYCHTKGVSAPHDQSRQKWRRLMSKYVIEDWKNCVALLELGYDAVGVNWRVMPPISHFSGTFWWASTEYLKTLAPFGAYYNKPVWHIQDPINERRLACEFWISSGPNKPKIMSLHGSNIDFCRPSYWATIAI